MIIRNITTDRTLEAVRVSAKVEWEDSDREVADVYFQTSPDFADFLSVQPHTFLIGGILPAFHHGERRLRVEGEACPQLVRSVKEVVLFLKSWYRIPRPAIVVEVQTRSCLAQPPRPQATAAFLSGGVDSLATLRLNRRECAATTPEFILYGLLVYGFDIAWSPDAPVKRETFDRAMATMTSVATETGLTLIPLATNIRHLDPDVEFWVHQFHGAALGAVAHSLSNRINRTVIASTFDIQHLEPWGSHPLIDPRYSSCDHSILHDGVALSRLDKARIISEWDCALQNLRVCTTNPPGELNCGSCEKCLRTMTELLALGVLDRTIAFGRRPLTVDALSGLEITNTYQASCYREAVPLLRDRGHRAVAECIDAKLTSFLVKRNQPQKTPWKTRIRKADEALLGGRLTRLWRGVS